MESKTKCFSLSLFIVLNLYSGISGKRVENTLITEKDWEFLARFCFLSNDGTLEFEFEYPVEYKPIKFLLYFDAPDQWNSVYGTGKTCTEKMAILKPENNQILTLTELYPTWPGCDKSIVNGHERINCTNKTTFRSSRARWWFLAVSRCDQTGSSKTGMNITYRLHMMNSDDPGDILKYEFSADEFYILPIDISFLIVYIWISILTFICAILLRQRQLFHTTYKMYMAAIGCEAFSLFLMCVAYGRYSSTGYEATGTKIAARVFRGISTLVFSLMLLLMGKGFSITVGKLNGCSTMKLSIFFTLYAIAYAALLIIESASFDPGKVLYIYESPAGYGLIAIRLICWLWFTYGVVFTLKNHKNKGRFYYPFYIFYTIWFWAGPIVIFIAMYAMALWTREQTVVGVENFVILCGHVFFLVLTRPSAANENFPYHLRTTQIDAFTEDADGASDNSGPSNSYEVSDETGPDLTGLFVVSKTRSEKRNNNSDNEEKMSNENTETLLNNLPNGRGNRLPPLRNSSEQTTTTTTTTTTIPDSDRVIPSAPPPSYANMFQVQHQSNT